MKKITILSFCALIAAVGLQTKGFTSEDKPGEKMQYNKTFRDPDPAATPKINEKKISPFRGVKIKFLHRKELREVAKRQSSQDSQTPKIAHNVKDTAALEVYDMEQNASGLLAGGDVGEYDRDLQNARDKLRQPNPND